jgi:flagellar basal body-associated protein FliL
MKRIFVRLVLGFIVLCIFIAYANFGTLYLFPWTVKSLSEKANNGDEKAFSKLYNYYRYFVKDDNETINFYRRHKDIYNNCSVLIYRLLDRNATGDKEEVEEVGKNCEGYRK